MGSPTRSKRSRSIAGAAAVQVRGTDSPPTGVARPTPALTPLVVAGFPNSECSAAVLFIELRWPIAKSYGAVIEFSFDSVGVTADSDASSDVSGADDRH